MYAIRSYYARYCPSIEDKLVRFADKDRHQIFIEPEGLTTHEMYVQGMSTSLPGDVQIAMLRTMPGLHRCEVMRLGYAIEYDCIGTSLRQGAASVVNFELLPQPTDERPEGQRNNFV